MKKPKILNLYSGLGGNRHLWRNVDVTSVELNPHIAALYRTRYPQDIVIVEDAHLYLLENFKKFDFIWSSPKCVTHSILMRGMGFKKPRYTDLTLYEEILLLKYWSRKRFCVENVKPYYTPLIPYSISLDRHVFWTSSEVPAKSDIHFPGLSKALEVEYTTHKLKWLNIPYTIKDLRLPGLRMRQLVDNCVHPTTGLHLLNSLL